SAPSSRSSATACRSSSPNPSTACPSAWESWPRPRDEPKSPFFRNLRLPMKQALLCAVFFVSGLSALLYQTAWQRLLSFFGGSDAFAATLVVAAFMAGLGIGSLAGGRLADRLSARGRLLAFALSELAIALFAVG